MACTKASDWNLIRHFIPTENGPDPIVVASIGFDRHGFVARGTFPDGRSWGVQPLTFGQCTLGVWRPDVSIPGTNDDEWCYRNEILAVISAVLWQGDGIEPRWWHRHRDSARRRRYHPDGSYDEWVER